MRSALIEPDASGTFSSASYVYASARDWARFGLLLLNGGVWEGRRVLPEGWVEFMTTKGDFPPEAFVSDILKAIPNPSPG